MLSLNSPFRTAEPAYLYFWQLPVTKKYRQPRYYIGQVALQIIDQPNGEILHPVEVTGLWWTGNQWIYMVEMPPSHPDYKKGESELEELEEWELEPI